MFASSKSPSGEVHVFLTEERIYFGAGAVNIFSGCGRERLVYDYEENSYWAYATDDYKEKYGVCSECNLYLILGELAN